MALTKSRSQSNGSSKLEAALMLEWGKVSKEVTDTLIASMSTQYTLNTPTTYPVQPPTIKKPPVPTPVRPFVSEATTATTIPNSDSRNPRLLTKRTCAKTYEYQMTEVEKPDTFTQQVMAFLSDIQRQMATIGLRMQELEAQVKVKDDLITSLQPQINTKKKANATYANMAKKNASPPKKTAKTTATSPPATLEKEALQAFGSDSAMEGVEGDHQHTQQDL
ncbi:hypothetical protein BDF14DRAFT_1883079 [Spinellus fusiger]|nr:hypothetical protein BDF14DRAFT_1883079 [Spinellus fusiger]